MLAQDITILDGPSSTRQPPFVFLSVYVRELVCVCVCLSEALISQHIAEGLSDLSPVAQVQVP